MDKLLKSIKDRLPKFNDYLLRDFRKEQVNQSAEFIGIVFQEAIKLFRGEIEYKGYRILSPEERVQYNLNNKMTKGTINIRNCEWILANYEFVYSNIKYDVPIFLPYMHNGYIVINNTRYSIQLAIAEKVFTKINDGITAKVVRSPFSSWRNQQFQFKSLSSGENYFESIVTTKIHNKDKKKKKNQISSTIVHYLLCKYGYLRVLEIFNIKPEQLQFVEHIDKRDVDQYEYYAAQKVPKTKTPIMLKVDKSLLTQLRKRRVIASILYLLTHYKKHDIESLYDSDATIYKVMLGKIIYGNATNDAVAHNNIDNHMLSLNSYLDPITQSRLAASGIICNNIYDLLIYIFCNIDQMLITIAHSDLYDKRIDVLDNLLVNTIVKAIYYRFYTIESRVSKLQEKIVRSLLRISSRQIAKIYQSPIVRMNPSVYNDNRLISMDIKKVRQGGFKSSGTNSLINAPESRYHPSFAYVESAVAFSTSNPASAGSINPYLPIEPETGFIVKEDYASQVDEISQYLPFK